MGTSADFPLLDDPVMMFICPGPNETTLGSSVGPYTTMSRIWKLTDERPKGS